LTQQAAEYVVATAADACSARGRFVWCLSGGRTPRALYELLASTAFAPRIDWSRTHICFGDERCVPPDDPASNYRMVREALLQHVPIDADRVYRIAAEDPPHEAAAAYETTLQNLLGVSDSSEPLQPFDLVLLGLGSDGHTASLFPYSRDEPGRWVSARPAQPVWRITLTPTALNASEAAWFLVSGADKAERLAEVLYGPIDPLRLPAQRIAPTGSLRWLVDREAAAKLDLRLHAGSV
jgi:6-phosphogluconolactonase